MAVRRINKELADLTKHGLPEGIVYLRPVKDDNILLWEAAFHGPADTPYSEGVFRLSIKVPVDYPFKPPSVKFITPLYHCNVDSDGGICLDMLKLQAGGWSPANKLQQVVVGIRSLLDEPNPDSPLVYEIGQLLRRDKNKHDENAREFTLKHAKS